MGVLSDRPGTLGGLARSTGWSKGDGTATTQNGSRVMMARRVTAEIAAMKQRVMFLCSGNSARSQMAEGWLRHLAGDRFEVVSAGTEPACPLAPPNRTRLESL